MARRIGVTGGLVGLALLAMAAGCSEEAKPAPAAVEPGPAEAYLESALGFSADDAAAAAVRQEEIVAACMSEQGFEYVPDTSGYQVVDTDEIDPPPGSRGFAEQFGYGFAAAPEEMRATSSGVSPNEAVMAAMSPEELEAYTRALWGDDAVDGPSEGDTELGGCVREARNEVWGDVETDHVRAGLEDEIARIDAEVAPTDPLVMAAAAEWSECMADAGHPGYASPPDAEAAAWDAWMAFNGAIAADPTLGVVDDEGGGPVGEGDLATREAALATADWDCRAAADYDSVWSAARDRLQQEYVDAHRAELDAWVESYS